MRPSILLLVVSMLVAACGGRREVREVEPAPVASTGGVVILDVSATQPVVDTRMQAPPPSDCGVLLTVYDVQVDAGCEIDERVTRAPARLMYPCSGGPASAAFADSQFVGTVSPAGDVAIEIQTGFDFSDGCHWTTKQQIQGNLRSGSLSYVYREEPDRGQRGCASACLASATVRVQ